MRKHLHGPRGVGFLDVRTPSEGLGRLSSILRPLDADTCVVRDDARWFANGGRSVTSQIGLGMAARYVMRGTVAITRAR